MQWHIEDFNLGVWIFLWPFR